jgi:tripartite-type tricarboxylate transporter receptor subunit TctC
MKKLLLLTAIAMLTTSVVQAQTWPTRNVRIIVPFAPGSTPDSMGRILADRLQTKLGVPFVVENKPGASGNTGTDAVVKSEADGYTIGDRRAARAQQIAVQGAPLRSRQGSRTNHHRGHAA